MSLLRRLLRPLLRPRVVFLAAFLVALSLAAAKAALATFVSANCNYNAPTPSPNMYRDGSVTVALVARYEGYHWGGGCWNPGSSAHGACYGSCPNCSHSGTWGADCSGYVAKIWQVPGASALTSCSHPYSTYNFYNQHTHWSDISRSSVKKGDAYVHNSGGSGHIFLYDSGDRWGWVKAYEAKGCSYGIQHDTRMAYSYYKPIRRYGY